VRAAVERALAERNLTPDLGGTLTTADLTNRIVERVSS
jgi:isocitrate/isopropylmalate dehydrogenase